MPFNYIMFVCISVCFGGCVWCPCNTLENMFSFVEKVNILVYTKFTLAKLHDNYFRINTALKKRYYVTATKFDIK